ncbi:Competence protein [Flavobacteriaceae bacterium 3519-10]|nr:Competence protein [Flavobacteriaceae bacterium 3519-10]
MQKQPVLILCVSFIIGIVLQDYLLLKTSSVRLLLVVGFLMLALYFVNNFHLRRFRHIPLLFLFVSLGIFAHSLNNRIPQLPDIAGSQNVVFKINRKLNSNEKNRRYEISAWKGDQFFLSVLSVPREEPELDFLHYYKASLYINRLQKAYSDFQFDYGKYLARKNIYFQSYLGGSFATGTRKDVSFSEKIRQKRLEILKKIDESGLSRRTREFTKGIILADRTEMDSGTVQDFSKSGLMHILAISGSHMAIIFWLILLFLNRIFPPKLRNFKIVISLALIWAFAVFIGYGSSVVRSCIMISAYYIYILLQRKPDLLHAMAVAAFIILIADTHQFYDVGFQLSFLAVFGIFWLNQPILNYLPRPKNNFQNFLVNVVSVSVAAQIVTLPLVLFYFHQYSFISILANLIVIPFSEVLIIFSLLMTVLTAFSLEFKLLNLIYDSFVSAALEMIHLFAVAGFAFYRMIPMSMPEVLVSFVMIYFLRFAILRFTIKNAMRIVYFLLLFVALRMLLNYKANEIDEVLVHRYFRENVLSVKKKDRVQFFLINGSDSEKITQYIIEPYLTARRTKNYEIKTLPRGVEEVRINGVTYKLIQNF